MNRYGRNIAQSSGSPLLGIGAGALVLALAGVMAACSDGGADSLSGGLSGAGTASGPQASASSGSSGSTGSGSTPSVPTYGSGTTTVDAGPPEPKGEVLFRALQTNLVATCGGTSGICHVSGAFQGGTTPVWLGAPDPYISAKVYPGIITSDPYSSKLLIKGPHEGPDFSGPNAALGVQVTAWLTQEAVEIVGAVLPTTTPVNVRPGPNVIDISQMSKGIPGASISFDASLSGSILTLTNLSVEAPVSAGLHIAHPIFATVPATGPVVPDPVDSMSNVDQTLTPAESTILGTGILVLEGFASGSQLEVELTTLAAVAPPAASDAGSGSSGCKNVAAFTADAVPAIQANQCLNCHDSGGSGNGSLDLSQVGKNDALACGQALTKVNLTNPSQSDIILAPTGQVAAHPFMGASASYVTMMQTWIAAE